MVLCPSGYGRPGHGGCAIIPGSLHVSRAWGASALSGRRSNKKRTPTSPPHWWARQSWKCALVRLDDDPLT